MTKIICMFTFLFIAFSVTHAAEPVIFFSDLTSGPNIGGENNNGAFVTVWGNNFGARNEGSFVTIGNEKAAAYPVWQNDKITFQLGPDAKSGEILVITPEGISNRVPFTVRGGTIIFVGPSGDDYKGDGSRQRPFRTLFQVKRLIRAGDIVYFMDGFAHTETDAYGAYVNLDVSGNEVLPMALIAYPAAQARIGGPGLGRCFHNWVSGEEDDHNSKYWLISQLYLESAGCVIEVGEGFRVIGNIITAPRGDGATAAIHGRGPGARILGNTLIKVGHEKSSKLYHNIYINNDWKGTSTGDIEIGWNHISQSSANRGIQIYADKNKGFIEHVSIHDNLIHDIRGNALNINQHTKGTITVYNNIIYKCGLGPDFSNGVTDYSGVLIAPEPDAIVYFFHNIVYDCGNPHRPGGTGLLAYRSGMLYAINNIFGGQGNIIAPGTGVPAPGKYGNLFFGRKQHQQWDTAAVYEHPRFIDIDNFDFRLDKESPAIDKGRALKSPVGRRDYDGNPRPQGAGFDIGPFEISP